MDSKISDLTAITEAADADEIVVVDKSDTTMAASGTNKKITAVNLFTEVNDNLETVNDNLETGWIPASSAWSYSSWDSTVRTAGITTASDETGHIQLGDRISFSQTTDGVKYAIVTAITSSLITCFMYDTQDFDNETITLAKYSHQKNPYGFDANPEKWTMEVTNSTQHSQSSPTVNVWYNIGSIEIVIPIGAWDTSYQVGHYGAYAATDTVSIYSTFGTTTSNSIGIEWEARNFISYRGTHIFHVSKENVVTLTTKDTYYLNHKTNLSSQTTIGIDNDDQMCILRAKCAYL